MSGRNGLISTAELADILGQADLRLFDCTTYLEPAPEGSQPCPISPCPDGTRSRPGIFRARIFWICRASSPIPDTELRFMMPDVAQLEARVRPSRRIATAAGWCCTASARRCGRRGSGGCCTSLGFENVAVLDGGLDKWKLEGRAARNRTGEGISAGDVHGETEAADFSSTSTRRSRPPPSATPSSSTRSARNFTRAWSRAATAGPAAFPAAATCRRRRCSIRRPRPSSRLREAEAKFKAQGITKDKRVVAYCGGGISATDRPVPAAPARLRQPHALRRLDGRMGQGCVAADRDGLGRLSPSLRAKRSNPSSAIAEDGLPRYALQDGCNHAGTFGSGVTFGSGLFTR